MHDTRPTFAVTRSSRMHRMLRTSLIVSVICARAIRKRSSRRWAPALAIGRVEMPCDCRTLSVVEGALLISGVRCTTHSCRDSTKRAIRNRNESRQFALWQIVADVGGLRERGGMWHHRRSRDGGSGTRQLP